MLVPDGGCIRCQALTLGCEVELSCVYTPTATLIWECFKVNDHTGSLGMRLRAELTILIQRQGVGDPQYGNRRGRVQTWVQGILSSARWVSGYWIDLGGRWRAEMGGVMINKLNSCLLSSHRVIGTQIMY